MVAWDEAREMATKKRRDLLYLNACGHAKCVCCGNDMVDDEEPYNRVKVCGFCNLFCRCPQHGARHLMCMKTWGINSMCNYCAEDWKASLCNRCSVGVAKGGTGLCNAG